MVLNSITKLRPELFSQAEWWAPVAPTLPGREDTMIVACEDCDKVLYEAKLCTESVFGVSNY